MILFLFKLILHRGTVVLLESMDLHFNCYNWASTYSGLQLLKKNAWPTTDSVHLQFKEETEAERSPGICLRSPTQLAELGSTSPVEQEGRTVVIVSVPILINGWTKFSHCSMARRVNLYSYPSGLFWLAPFHTDPHPLFGIPFLRDNYDKTFHWQLLETNFLTPSLYFYSHFDHDW